MLISNDLYETYSSCWCVTSRQIYENIVNNWNITKSKPLLNVTYVFFPRRRLSLYLYASTYPQRKSAVLYIATVRHNRSWASKLILIRFSEPCFITVLRSFFLFTNNLCCTQQVIVKIIHPNTMFLTEFKGTIIQIWKSPYLHVLI